MDNIFYAPAYLRYIEDVKKRKIYSFLFRKNKSYAFLPYFKKRNVLFGVRYGGMVSNSIDSKFHVLAVKAFFDHCRERKIRKYLLRYNPFTTTIKLGKPIKREPFICIFLDENLPKLRASISKSHRKNIGKAKKENLEVFETKDAEYLKIFFSFYRSLFKTKGKEGPPFSGFQKLALYMKKEINFVCVGSRRKIVAVSLILKAKPNVFMMYGAMNEEGYDKCAKHLMIYELMARYKKRGYLRLVLGTGAEGKKDSIYRFKRGFTDKESYIYTYGADI